MVLLVVTGWARDTRRAGFLSVAHRRAVLVAHSAPASQAEKLAWVNNGAQVDKVEGKGIVRVIKVGHASGEEHRLSMLLWEPRVDSTGYSSAEKKLDRAHHV